MLDSTSTSEILTGVVVGWAASDLAPVILAF